MGMPVAYALGIGAILAALYTGIPLEAVMLKVSGGMSSFSLLAIPFFILCGAIMAVGGVAGGVGNFGENFFRFLSGGLGAVQNRASSAFWRVPGAPLPPNPAGWR